MRTTLILVLLLSVSSISLATSDDWHVIVHNQRLFVGRDEFFIKGMCYSPAPIGYSNSTGLCSPRLTPWGEWKSACFDSDFTDGSVWSAGTGPSGNGGWFSKLWERDIPAMAAAGVNTLRLYSANAVTQTASVIYNGTRSIVVSGAGKEHRKFLDMCWSYGIKVIFPLLSDCNMYLSLDNDTVQWMLRNQIDEVGDHPALLMYQIGNEWTLQCTDWQLVTRLMGAAVQYARDYQFTRWQRLIPMTTGVVNSASQFDYILANMAVDVFGVNSYEGARGSFTMPSLYNTYKPLMCKYGAALFIAEFNPQSYSNAGREYENGVPTYWRDFTSKSDANGLIGAAFFEWTNEPRKGNANDLGVMMLQTAIEPTTNRSSVSLNGWNVVDLVVAKNITLTSISSGKFNNMPCNYNTDIWSLIGRAPYTLDNVPAICTVNAPGYPSATIMSSLSVTTTSRTSTSASTTAASTSTLAASMRAMDTTVASTTASVSNAVTSTKAAVSLSIASTTSSAEASAIATQAVTVSASLSLSASATVTTGATTSTAAPETASPTLTTATLTNGEAATTDVGPGVHVKQYTSSASSMMVTTWLSVMCLAAALALYLV